jgi:hypothetical protein
MNENTVNFGRCQATSPTHRMDRKIDPQSPMQLKNEQALHDSCNGVCSFYREITISPMKKQIRISLHIYVYMLVGYLTTLSVARLNSVKWMDYRWMIRKGFERKRSLPTRGIIPKFACTCWVKPRTTSFRIVDVPTEIRTEHVKSPIPTPIRCPPFVKTDIQ